MNVKQRKKRIAQLKKRIAELEKQVIETVGPDSTVVKRLEDGLGMVWNAENPHVKAYLRSHQ